MSLSGCVSQPSTQQKVKPSAAASSSLPEPPAGPYPGLTQPPPVIHAPTVLASAGHASSKNGIRSQTPPAKKYDYNWDTALAGLMADIRKNIPAGKGNTVFVGMIKNNTNGAVEQARGRERIISTLQRNGVFRIVPMAASRDVRATLGLRASDTLSTVGKMMAVARECGAQYLFFPTMKGNVKSPVLAVKMLETTSGEISFASRYTLHSVGQIQ